MRVKSLGTAYSAAQIMYTLNDACIGVQSSSKLDFVAKAYGPISDDK